MQMSKERVEGSILAEIVPPGLGSGIWFESQSADSLLRISAFWVSWYLIHGGQGRVVKWLAMVKL